MLLAANKGVGTNIGFPDPCNTVVGPATVPLPYPDLALNSQAAPFVPHVKLTMMNALNMATKIVMTSGMEAGAAHPLIKGTGSYTMGNPIVKIAYLAAINLLCPTTGNNMNNGLGAVLVPSLTNVFFTWVGGANGGASASARRGVSAAEIERMQAELSRGAPASAGLALVWVSQTDDADSGRGRIVHVRRNSLGERMGLRAGDEIVGAGGSPAAELGVEGLCDALAPAPGETISLKILRPEATQDCLVEGTQLAREPETVRSQTLEDGIGYLEISVFTENVPTLVHNEICKLEARGMRALVIDLRGNPGGDFDAFTRLADDFLDQGRELVRVIEADGDESIVRARQEEPYQVPTVVLVDGGTVSAAELFAGSLQANGRATVVGQTTFGKGVAHQLRPESTEGGAAHTAVAGFRLPGGGTLNGCGVVPDVEILAECEQGRPIRTPQSRRSELPQPADDRQLRAACRSALRGEVDA